MHSTVAREVHFSRARPSARIRGALHRDLAYRGPMKMNVSRPLTASPVFRISHQPFADLKPALPTAAHPYNERRGIGRSKVVPAEYQASKGPHEAIVPSVPLLGKG